MNAIALITARPVCKPIYFNNSLPNFGNWYRDNEPALSQYFRDLGGSAAMDTDFFDFCATQYDIERIANPAPVYVRADRVLLPALSYEEYMEDVTGKPATGPL